jgi:hypothetical protein
LADPVLTATLSGQRAILLSWTFDSNADFQVFWKSSVPAGQEYVLLGSTNAFSFTTPDLEPSKTYTFYVRANVGSGYFYSNVVELFVSCGKGIVLEVDPPPSPPAQKRDIYACVSDGDIYQRFSGTGQFIALGQTSRAWAGICVGLNDDVYACSGSEVYVRAGGQGNFIALGAPIVPTITAGAFWGMCAAPNGDIYLAHYTGGNPNDIYVRAGGVGNFVGTGAPSGKQWTFMAAAPNGDIYAAHTNYGVSDIYKRTGGAGPWVALGLNHYIGWQGMGAGVDGAIYSCVNYSGSDIHKSTNAGLSFSAMGQGVRLWQGMGTTKNGDVYATVAGGDIYMLPSGGSSFIALGQTARSWSGIGSRMF